MNVDDEILMQTSGGFFEEHETDSVDDEKEQVVVDKLIQEDKLKRQTAILEIIEGDAIRVGLRGQRKPKVFSIPLYLLNPKPVHSLRVNWNLVLASLVFFAVVSGLVFSEFDYHISSTIPYTYSVIVGLTTVAFILMLLAAYQYKNVYTYFSLHGGTNVFEINKNMPDNASVNAFITKLESHISNAKRPGKANLLAMEVKEHRKLVEKGVISEVNYDEAKKRILASHD